MLLKRYGGGFDRILNMPFLVGIETIRYATDAEQEDKLFLRWVTGYQLTMGFEEFKRELLGDVTCREGQTTEEILEDVRDIIG